MRDTQTLERLDKLGEYETLKAIAQQNNVTSNAVYLWVKYHEVPFVRLGRSILVHQSKALEYTPRSKR